MNIREKIRKLVAGAVESYDFTDSISEAIDDIDIDYIVYESLHEKIKKIDITRYVEGAIRKIIDDELSDLDIDALICDELDNI